MVRLSSPGSVIGMVDWSGDGVGGGYVNIGFVAKTSQSEDSTPPTSTATNSTSKSDTDQKLIRHSITKPTGNEPSQSKKTTTTLIDWIETN